jgi:UPF0716 protein FxsA
MLIALMLLILWPVLEVFVAIALAGAIGWLATILLLIASWPIGTWAMRSQGRAALRRLGDAVAAGRPPGREVFDGALVLIGGALLIVPGFITDILGASLLLRPTRSLVRALLLRNFQGRLVTSAARFSGRGAPAPAPYDVDSTAHDVDQPRLQP